MSRREISKLLQEEMGEYLAEKGFKVLSDCSIVKKTKDLNFALGIGIKSYDYKYIEIFQPFIQIHKIEQPLNRMYYFDMDEKEIKKKISISDTVFGSSMGNKPKYPYQVGKSKLDFPLRSIYDLEELAEMIKEYLENTAFPFFEKYSNLHNINQEIMDYDTTYQEGVGFKGNFTDLIKIPIVGDDPIGKFRRMFIMKYCNDSKYDEYIKWLEDTIKSTDKITNEDFRIELLKISKDIQEYLSKLDIS